MTWDPEKARAYLYKLANDHHRDGLRREAECLHIALFCGVGDTREGFRKTVSDVCCWDSAAIDEICEVVDPGGAPPKLGESERDVMPFEVSRELAKFTKGVENPSFNNMVFETQLAKTTLGPAEPDAEDEGPPFVFIPTERE